ncbi:MAG: RNA polymerase sigma factor [Candidatus Eremiobacteraeota bacterium]|nr:RNA polymerase sigma factor [Candidatus Eremiobacteraeota bacterium]
MTSSSESAPAIEAIWGIESPKLVAALTRVVRDVGLAEEFAQDAFVAALSQWPTEGIPRNPGAWLMSVSKRRAIDYFRRAETAEVKYRLLGSDLQTEEPEEAVFASLDDDYIPDDLLRLVFIACHPVLSVEGRVALTLRLLGGLSTSEIARAFLSTEPTIAQRIVRAKRTLGEARVPFEVPDAAQRMQRLGSVLEVIYLIYNEGYSATSGDDILRPALAQEALRLGRVLAELTPEQSEVHGLVALMELQSSRSRARVGPSGEHVLLLDQNRALWDRMQIARGLAALQRAERSGQPLGPYALQAAIAACHARAHTAEETDWSRIAALYDALTQVHPTPVVKLNRAVAVGMAFGAASGLELVDALAGEPSLQSYHLLPSVRGDFLEKLQRFSEARAEFERAAALAQNARDRELLLSRAVRCARAL